MLSSLILHQTILCRALKLIFCSVPMKYFNRKVTVVILVLLVHSPLQMLCAEECAISSPLYNDNNSRTVLPKKSQALVTTYRFQCCGMVTHYRAYLQPGGNGYTNVYNISFQVWRPSIQQQNLYYLVGETNATPAMLTSNGEANVPSYNISVQPGDVVGYTVVHQQDQAGGIQLGSNTHGNNTVWYGPIQQTEEARKELQIGPNSTFSTTRAAPILSIDVSPSSCDMTTSSQHYEPTPTQTTQSHGLNAVPAVVGVLISLVVVAVLVGTSIMLGIMLIKKRKSNHNRNGIFNPYYNPNACGSAWHKGKSNFNLNKLKSPTENQYEYVKLSYSTQQNGRCQGLDKCDSSSQYYASPTLAINHSSSDTEETRALALEYSHTQYRESALKSQKEEKHCEEENDLKEAPGLVIPNQNERKHSLNDYVMTYRKLEFFEREQTYWVPAHCSDALYDQLACRNYREIPKKDITILEKMNVEKFVKVSKARWNTSSSSLQIVIKQLRPNAADEERVKLLQEAAIMGQFWHANVVKLYGLVTITSPLSICFEYMMNGDLRHYLVNYKITRNEPPNGLKDIRFFFVQAAKDIASGMNYLASKAFVHRDLAARNVFLNENYVCKIGEFGKSRDLMDQAYYKSSSSTRIPIRWTAPEALLYKRYSWASDVWSYGIVLYEMWSLGKRPYPNLKNHEVVSLIQEGFCQSPPPGCPRALYRLMVDCWNPVHQQRPNFDEILTYLHQPVSELLKGSTDCKHSTQQTHVADLGAPTHIAKELYSDLQNKYKDKIYNAIYMNRECFTVAK